MKFEIRRARNGEFRAKIISRNGEQLFVSETYVGRAGALKAIRAVKRGAGGRIVDYTAAGRPRVVG